MHGGAAGSGAQLGNRNALKHGNFSHEVLATRKMVNQLAQEARKLIEEVG